MTFVSYAQNFEDVMLWRALKHVECGFYIDVGANDPEIDSVTKAFYDRGWRGINIEPIAQWFKRLEEKRQRDINLQIAAGAQQGELVIYELPDTGLSTMDRATAEHHEAERGYIKQERVVPVETLTSICQRFHLAPIHFMKIDVEGAEKDVLQGIDLLVIRPWIVIIESTLPNTQIENYAQWEPFICGANYEYVYFDGLNRYYIAREHYGLKKFFNSPPNIFDEFISRQQLDSELRAQAAEGKATEAEARATEAEARAAALQTELETTQQELHVVHQSNHNHWQLAEARRQEILAMLNSTSWRITAPLRKASSALRSLTPNALKPRAKVFLQHAALYVGRRPWLKNAALKALNRFPRLKSRLFQIVTGIRTQPVQPQNVPNEIAHFSPRARQIHADLKAAIERRKKENG